jgi:hypothetical protein
MTAACVPTVSTNLFVSNVFDKQAALSRFITDNYDASTRSRIFTNRPRTAGCRCREILSPGRAVSLAHRIPGR